MRSLRLRYSSVIAKHVFPLLNLLVRSRDCCHPSRPVFKYFSWYTSPEEITNLGVFFGFRNNDCMTPEQIDYIGKQVRITCVN